MGLSVKSGMDEYDMSCNHDNQTVSNAMNGYFLNIRVSDIFNFDAPWRTRTAEDFTVGGGIFAGDWYLEDLIGLTKDMNRDLDGDGAITLGKDQYGFMASTLGLVNFQVSLGISVVGKDEEGYLTFSVDRDRLSSALDAMERLMENGLNKDNVPGEPWGYGTVHFADGKVLFNYPQILDIPAQMHDTDVRFGTLPPPKLDENQKDCISGCFDVYWAIPKTACHRLDVIAAIIEGRGHNCFYGMTSGTMAFGDREERVHDPEAIGEDQRPLPEDERGMGESVTVPDESEVMPIDCCSRPEVKLRTAVCL